jgi:hypothetical protein
LQNLRKAMVELGITDDNLVITEVPDMESARRMNFQGSPTILVDGVDIYTGNESAGFSYVCRLYEFNVQQTGVIPTEFIRMKLAEYR